MSRMRQGAVTVGLAEQIAHAYATTGEIPLPLVAASWDHHDIIRLGDELDAINPAATLRLLSLRRQNPPRQSHADRLKQAADAATMDALRDLGWQPPSAADPLHEWNLVDWATFWGHETDADEDWIVEPLFARGRGHAVYAGAKTGKSWSVLAACAAVATGRTFLGFTNPAATVLYVDYEMTEADIRDRLRSFGYGPDDDLSRLHYALLVSTPPLDTPEGGHALLAAAQTVSADLVVIDTTSRAVEGEENSSDTYKAFYRHTGAVLKHEGIALVRLDHSGKTAEKGMRGSSAKADDVDVVWRMERTDNGQQWKATHRRMGWVPEAVTINVIEDTDEDTFTFSGAGPAWPAGTKDCADILDNLGLSTEISTRAAQMALTEAGEGRRRRVVVAAVKWRKERHFDPGTTPDRYPTASNGTQNGNTTEPSGEQARDHAEPPTTDLWDRPPVTDRERGRAQSPAPVPVDDDEDWL